MAAGMGSRFGGLKQLSPVGPCGEHLMDYSVYDALRAGFGKVVFVIKRETEQAFREAYGRKLEHAADVRYAFQDIDDVPGGANVPAGRVKPWGTAHAVLAARHDTHEPFAVINADDFYGALSFRTLGEFLAEPAPLGATRHRYAMVGFALRNTLSEGGSVSRGVCRVSGDGKLAEITERTHIEQRGDVPCYTEDGHSFVPIDAGAVVSMNMWGFTPSIFAEAEREFAAFLTGKGRDSETAEIYLPSVVDSLLRQTKAEVSVLNTSDRWWGLTNPRDLQAVTSAIAEMTAQGLYPHNLWEN